MKKIVGFTLVELMISMSIIAILSVVLSISFSKAQKNGRDQRRIEDLKAIQSAAEQYYLLAGSYPANSTAPWRWPSNSTGQVVLQKYPIDPKNDITGGYIYTSNVGTTGYCICAKLEEPSKNSNADDNVCTFANTGYFCIKNQQ